MKHPTLEQQRAQIETVMREERRLLGVVPSKPEAPQWARAIPQTSPPDPSAPPVAIPRFVPPPMTSPGVAIVASAPPPGWARPIPRATPGPEAIEALRERGVDEETLRRFGVEPSR